MLAHVRGRSALLVGAMLAAAVALAVLFWPAFSATSERQATSNSRYVAESGTVIANDVAVVTRSNWASDQSMERWQLLLALVVVTGTAAGIAFTSEGLADGYHCPVASRRASSTLARAPPRLGR